MNWKNWPYWVKGALIGFIILICGAIVLSSFLAFSSLCGFNPSGPGESHTCTLSERLDMVLVAVEGSLSFPFVAIFNTLRILLEYGPSEMIFRVMDASSFLYIINPGVIIVGTLLGYLYGKIKNRRKVI